MEVKSVGQYHIVLDNRDQHWDWDCSVFLDKSVGQGTGFNRNEQKSRSHYLYHHADYSCCGLLVQPLGWLIEVTLKTILLWWVQKSTLHLRSLSWFWVNTKNTNLLFILSLFILSLFNYLLSQLFLIKLLSNKDEYLPFSISIIKSSRLALILNLNL